MISDIKKKLGSVSSKSLKKDSKSRTKALKKKMDEKRHGADKEHKERTLSGLNIFN